MRALLVGLVAACGTASTRAPVRDTPVLASAPERPRASYRVMPGELGDADVLAKISHHARLVRYGLVRLAADGQPVNRSEPGTDLEQHVIALVMGETHDRVRVVSDDDGARVALWIERADLASVTVARFELADEGGHAAARAGVWAEPGVEIKADRSSGKLHEIELDDGIVVVRGWAPQTALGTIWVGPEPAAPKTAPGAWIDTPEKIREAPRADGRVLAEIKSPVMVVDHGRRDGWADVEVTRAGFRVRGFVAADHVYPQEPMFETSGRGGGFGYGISDTDRFEIPAGACLYDREGGEVVGVDTKTMTRYGYHRRGSEWAVVYVGSAWGILELRAHDAGHGDQPAWESCLP